MVIFGDEQVLRKDSLGSTFRSTPSELPGTPQPASRTFAAVLKLT